MDAELRCRGEKVSRQLTRNRKQRARESVGKRSLLGRVFDLRLSPCRNMAVKKKDRTVVCSQCHDLATDLVGVAVTRFAVSEMQNGRRKTARVFRQPTLENVFHSCQCLTHRSLSVGDGVN